MSDLSSFLDQLANRFSEGWHDGIKIDATDIVDMGKAADHIRELEAEVDRLKNRVNDRDCRIEELLEFGKAAEAKLAKIAALETYYYHGAGDFYRKADITALLKEQSHE